MWKIDEEEVDKKWEVFVHRMKVKNNNVWTVNEKYRRKKSVKNNDDID